MKGHRAIKGERGNVLILTTLALTFLLAMGGIAIDLAYLSVAKGELQRSVDAAALAGAGKIGFGDAVFPTVRSRAEDYAGLNPYRGGIVALNDGNITLGVWNSTKAPDERFQASTEGSRVNAVRCQYATTIQTSFLKLLGFDNLPVAAEAIAVATPPLKPPPNTCIFPIGLSQCAFRNPEGTFNNSTGCGALVSFVATGAAVAPPTAAWVNVSGASPWTATANNLAVNNVGDGLGCPVTLAFGNSIEATATMPASTTVALNIRNRFIARLGSDPITVTNGEGASVYEGPGWIVYVPVIDTGSNPCPPPTVTGSFTIVGWTRFVIKGFNDQGTCWGSVPDAATACIPPYLHRVIWGHYDCTYFDAPYNPSPAPISALSRRLWLAR